MSLQHYLPDENATLAFAERLAGICQRFIEQDQGGLTLFLGGTLGAGKTTLSRGMINALGHSGAVKSPTYTLVEPYELSGLAVWHFDLYRLADPEELEFMGIRDYFDASGIRLIEWAERGQGVLPMADLVLNLQLQLPGRSVSIEALSDAGKTVLAALTKIINTDLNK